jgi:hypothetical protein
MVKIILLVWFILTFPIVYHVDKSMKGTELNWLRHKPAFQLILIWKAWWSVPVFYFLVIKEFLTFKK